MPNIIGTFPSSDKYAATFEKPISFIVYDDYTYRVSHWAEDRFTHFRIENEQVFIKHTGELVFNLVTKEESSGRYRHFVENILMIMGEYNMLNSPGVNVITTKGE